MNLTRAELRHRVTDHAILRYLERFEGFDIDGLRRQILTPETYAGLLAGVTRVKIGEAEFVAAGGRIVTVTRARKRTPKAREWKPRRVRR